MIFLFVVEVWVMAQRRLLPDSKHGSPDDLITWSKEAKSPLEVKRFIAIRMLMTGCRREDVMHFFAVSWSALQKWVRLWNKGGKEALLVGKPSGRPPRLTTEAKDYIVKKIEFVHPKTGERITGRAISGVLKKNIRNQIKEKCDLLSSSEDGLSPHPPP